MNLPFNRRSFSIAAALASLMLVGCGSSPSKQNKDFFTSGSPEADQRAEQRMAQQQQLTGNSNNGGEKTTTNNANIATEKRSLYQSLGGADGINAIVDDWVNRALADPSVNWDRIGIKRGGFDLHRGESMTWDSNAGNVKIMKMHMAQFLAVRTGGPTTYTGKDITSAHANMHITNAEFDAATGDLKATLDKLQIANTEQKELLSIVESTRAEIVEER